MPYKPSTPPPSVNNNSTPSKGDATSHDLSRLNNYFLNRTIHDAGHDLKSPLLVIRGYSQLLQKVEDKGALNRGIKLMEEASFKMENIVNGMVELMDIYTLPSGERENLSIDKYIDNACENLAALKEDISSIVEKNIALNKDLYFNEKHLEIILTSCIDNAIRHNIEQEDLKIKLICTQNIDGSILLVIADNGKGIDPEVESANLKKPFYKYGEGHTGVGIGLAKVEAVAQITNNTFTIESIPKRGTKCTFHFQNQSKLEEVNAVVSIGARRAI